MTTEPDAPRWFYAGVLYATQNGNPGAWHGDVFATWDTVHDVAQAAAKKARRSIGKINGGDAVAYAPDYIPSGQRRA